MSPVKIHRHLLTAVLEAAQSIVPGGTSAPQVIEGTLRSHPKWGSRDRRFFADQVTDLVRSWRWSARRAGVPDGIDGAEMPDDAALWRIWTARQAECGHPLPEEPECADWDEAAAKAREATAPPAVRASMPDWLYARGEAEIGAAWAEICAALNQPAAVTLRANALRTTPAGLAKRLAGDGIGTTTQPERPDALVLDQRRSLLTSLAWKEGWFEVQDGSSQEIAPFVQAEPGMLVIDACAGAGGKTLHLAALTHNKARLVALDVHASRLEELERRASRSGASSIRTQVIDSPDVIARRAGTADRVLLDVPCSGLGVLRRHPDTRWKLTAEELDRLETLQQQILTDSAVMLKPGGKLVYATCSILPSENGAQVRAFLERNPDQWTLEEERALPPGPDGDGFYAARLVRRKS